MDRKTGPIRKLLPDASSPLLNNFLVFPEIRLVFHVVVLVTELCFCEFEGLVVDVEDGLCLLLLLYVSDELYLFCLDGG